MTSDESWHRGYFADTGYTHGYFREMAPSYLAWAALMQGVAVPTRDFRYVDLGCGQGFGLILLAACHPDSQFIGVDFMPAHVAHARQLAREGGVDEHRAKEVIERMITVAGTFRERAASAPIRAATVNAVWKTIAANRDRLA